MADGMVSTIVSGINFRAVREDTCDERIAGEVVTRDVYRMRAMHAEGVVVDAAVDIGAHIGSWSLLVRSLWPKAQVVAFEPWPSSYGLLEHNVGGYDIKAINAAVIGDATTARCMSVTPPGKPLNTGAVRLKDDGIPIEVITVAAVLREVDCIDVLKLDCEGAEVDILETAATLGALWRVGYIAGEYHQCHVPDAWPRIQRALAATHTVEQGRSGRSTGMFFAQPNGTV